jgi:hypothetical protein
MRLAIMQPYFFPYIGYWQLIHAADRFVLFDDAQYMRHGWVNRNRILKPGGGWQYIMVPLQKHGMTAAIREVQAHPDLSWRERVVAQLAHYRKKAPCYEETMALVREALFGHERQDISGINANIVGTLCPALGLDREIIISSERGFDYADVKDSGEWALRISEQMGATEYINPISGASLFDGRKFLDSGIQLSFLQSQEITYRQPGAFEPALSIIDVLMFNGTEGTRLLLDHYAIEPAES